MLISPILDIDGEFFAQLEQAMDDSGFYQLDRYKLELFQDILDHLEQMDELARTDFLCCLLKVSLHCRETLGLLELDNLKCNLDRLYAWDLELAEAILALNPPTMNFAPGLAA